MSRPSKQDILKNLSTYDIIKMFVKTKPQPRGGSLLDSAINSGVFPEMHYRSPAYGIYNFAGPFTDLKKRLKPDGSPQPWSTPVNQVDQTAYIHDVNYMRHTDNATRKLADQAMIDSLESIINNPNTPLAEYIDAIIVQKAIQIKKLFGLGKRKRK